MLTFEEASAVVRDTLRGSARRPPAEAVPLNESRGRILAEELLADRDYPPFHRATRGGVAVRSAGVTVVPVTLEGLGLARAGAPYFGELAARTGVAVEIMTGA